MTLTFGTICGDGTSIVKAFDQSVEVAPPNLFRTSSQVRTEGLSIFYRYHPFYFCIRDLGLWEINLKGIHERVQYLDQGARKKIRQIEMVGDFLSCQIEMMELIPSELSAEATIFYTSCTPAHYKTTELQEIDNQYQLKSFPIYYVGSGLPDCKKPTFLPGMDWFGQAVATDDTTNVAEEEWYKDITTRIQEKESHEGSSKATSKKRYFYHRRSREDILERLWDEEFGATDREARITGIWREIYGDVSYDALSTRTKELVELDRASCCGP